MPEMEQYEQRSTPSETYEQSKGAKSLMSKEILNVSLYLVLQDHRGMRDQSDPGNTK